MMEFITAIFCCAYSAFLLWCVFQFIKIKSPENNNLLNDTKVAIIVPVRNEEENILTLLDEISKQSYKNFQIIICDDHSTDKTFEKINGWKLLHPYINLEYILNNGSSKKDALTTAINHSDSTLIITTDADCRMGSEWITAIVKHFKSTGAYLIAGAVKMESGDNLFGKIQSAEYAGLMLMSAAGIQSGHPMFCSGANLAFIKKYFSEVNGYNDSKSASGDDTQLLRKIALRWPDKISFLKDDHAMVSTSGMKKFSQLFQQRKRWASKIPATLSLFTITVAVVAWLTHLLLMIASITAFCENSFMWIIIFWLIKISCEIFLLQTVSRFMKQKLAVLSIILIQPFYAVYIVLVGLISPFTKFKWKERISR